MNRAKYVEFATDVMCNRTWPTSYNCIDYSGRKELKVHFKGHFTVSIHFVDTSTRYISQIHVDNTLFGTYECWGTRAVRNDETDRNTWYGIPEAKLEYWLVKACLGVVPDDVKQGNLRYWAGKRGDVPQTEVQGQLWYQVLLSPDGSWA
jgi:hypothetical protein